MKAEARGWLYLAGVLAAIACSSEETDLQTSPLPEQPVTHSNAAPEGSAVPAGPRPSVLPSDAGADPASPPPADAGMASGSDPSGATDGAQRVAVEQTVKCKLKGELVEFEYEITRKTDGTSEVLCRAAWNGPGVQYPGPLEKKIRIESGGDPFGRCRLAPLITADGYVELFRTEASLDQEMVNPATVRHGGVYVDLEYGGTRGEWWMEDADPSRQLEGSCVDSKGN